MTLSTGLLPHTQSGSLRPHDSPSGSMFLFSHGSWDNLSLRKLGHLRGTWTKEAGEALTGLSRALRHSPQVLLLPHFPMWPHK